MRDIKLKGIKKEKMKMPDGVKMQDFYRRWFERALQNAVNTVHNNSLGNYTTAYNTWKRVESIKSLFKEEISLGKSDLCILDAGCGDALPLYLIASQDNAIKFKFYGIDASELDITFAENLRLLCKLDNITFKVGNIETPPYQDSFFDIVICSEVLEHMERPEDFLVEIKRVLKDDGVVIISTPNEDNPVIKFGSIFKNSHKRSDKDIPAEKTQLQNNDNKYDAHINTRGIKSWTRTFFSTGFRVEAIKRHSIMYGGYKYNRHRIFFACIIFLDWILDHFPFGYNLSEGVTYKLKKV